MRNIFITACYEVDHMYGNTSKEDYKQLTMKCCDSFMRNLIDLDEVIILTGNKTTYHELFKEIYWKIKDIYSRNSPCNILWSDSDNVCLRPLEIFDKFDKFAMFYSIEQYRTAFVDQTCLKLVENLSPWMMANLRYYPAHNTTMLFWDVGYKLATNWIEDWAYETIIYNAMFHAQGITDYNQFIKPEWNVQGEGDLNSITKDLVKDAVILHCHSTRNSGIVIQKMEKAQQLVKEE